MKSKKIFAVLLVLVFVVAVVASCADKNAQDAPGAPDCFVVKDEPVYSSISTLEGKLVSSYRDRNIVALMNEKLDPVYGAQSIFTVYDLTTGATFLNTSGWYFDWNTIKNLNISIEHFPLAVISYDKLLTDEEGNDYYETYYSYYLIDKEYTTLAEHVEGKSLRTGKVGNLNLYGIEDKLYWVSHDGRVVRESSVAISDTYSEIEYLDQYLDVNAEWNGFTYAWEFNETSRKVQIYNPSGDCTVEYKLPAEAVLVSTDAIINPRAFVLNNGSLLLQYFTEAPDDATAWDIMYNAIGTSNHFDLKTIMINNKDGSINEIDCNFAITELESSYNYDFDSEFPFELADGYENQAYIVRFNNGYFSEKVEYAVLDNSLTEKFIFPNDHLAYTGNYRILSYSANGYLAYTFIDGKYTAAKFHWDGKLVNKCSDNAMLYTQFTNDYYVTPSGVYDINGELKYDLVANGFVPDFALNLNKCFQILGNNIYLFKFNAETSGSEVYALNTDDWSVKLLVDGVDLQTASKGEGYYKVKNTETGVSTLYNSKNEIILKVLGDMMLYEAEDIVYVSVTVDDKDLVYVISPAKAN